LKSCSKPKPLNGSGKQSRFVVEKAFGRVITIKIQQTFLNLFTLIYIGLVGYSVGYDLFRGI